MFKSVKHLNSQKFENPYILDDTGKSITNEKKMYEIIRNHFSQHFYNDSHKTLQQFSGEPRKLQNEIKAKEVTTAVSKMSNNKTGGHDQITVEMIKYAPLEIHIEIANTLNNIFEHHIDTEIGKGILLPLPKPPKPDKPRGSVNNLRAIILFPIIRKILSSITLRR